MFGIAALKKCHFTERQEGTTPESTYFRDWANRLTVFCRNPLCSLLYDHCRPSKVTEVDHTYPAVFSICYIDSLPTVVFIHGQILVVIRFKCQILHTTLTHESCLFVNDGFRSSPLFFDTACNGCIERYLRTVNCCCRAMPAQIGISRMPRPVAHALASAE